MKRLNAGFGYYHWPDPGVAWAPNAANRKGQHPGHCQPGRQGPLLVYPHSAKIALEAHFEDVEGREGRDGVLHLVLDLELWNNGH